MTFSYWPRWKSHHFHMVAALVAGFLTVADGPAAQEGKEGGALMAEQKTIVVIGASYAGGWNLEKPLAGFRFINKGIGGQQSFEMLSRFEADVVALKPNAVIIWGFINDVFRSDRGQIEQTLTRTQESLGTMIRMAKEAGITPILATEVTVRSRDEWRETLAGWASYLLGKTSYQDYVNSHVVRINRWLRETAARDGILLLDFEAALSNDRGVRRMEFAQPDGSHISQRGYEALSQLTEARLRSASVHRP